MRQTATLTRTTTLALLVFAGACGPDSAPETAPEAPGQDPQAVSLFGEPLFEQVDTGGVIAAVDALLAEAPDDVERVIAAGRERRNFWQYRQAIELYTRAMQLAPGDWRPYRYRGHRYLSLREFDRGVTDLQAAKDRAPLNFDVSYHLGLAHFLSGDFSAAADEYLRCLALADDPAAKAAAGEDFRSCSENGDRPESMVAMTEWAVRALLRAGRTAEANELLASVPLDLTMETNIAYYHNLLFHKGLMSAADLLEGGPDAPY
jgi:tetratricopeptide (TPR) repeat protein